MSREKEGGGGSKIITSTLQMGIALELHKPSHLGIKDWTGSSNQEREGERESHQQGNHTAACLGSPRTAATFTGEDAEADWDGTNLRAAAPSLIRAVPPRGL